MSSAVHECKGSFKKVGQSSSCVTRVFQLDNPRQNKIAQFPDQDLDQQIPVPFERVLIIILLVP